MAIPAGYDPAIFCVTGRYVSQLHYGTVMRFPGYPCIATLPQRDTIPFFSLSHPWNLTTDRQDFSRGSCVKLVRNGRGSVI